MTAYGRTVAAVFALFVIAGVVEALAFTTQVFVPITWTIVDGSNAVALLPLCFGILAGHFWPPRVRPSGHALTKGYVPLSDTARAAAALTLIGLTAAVLFTIYMPASALFAGYDAGAVFFLSGDRRKA